MAIISMPDDPNIARRRRGEAMLMQGLQGIANMQRRDEETARQRALQSLNLQKELASSGVEVTPEISQQVEQAVSSGSYGNLGSLFTGAAQAKRSRAEEQSQFERDLKQQELELKRQQAASQAALKQAQAGYYQQRAKAAPGLKMQEQQAFAQMPAASREKLVQEQALKKLPSEAKKAVGGIAAGFDALNRMKMAIERGDDADYFDPETPIVGSFLTDTPFSEARRVMTDVVGRLQSGGAINADEEARFEAMGPRAGDSRERQLAKLDQQKDFLENKLRAYGLKSEALPALGFRISEYTPLQLSDPKAPQVMSANAPINSVNPFPAAQATPGPIDLSKDPEYSELMMLRQRAGMP